MPTIRELQVALRNADAAGDTAAAQAFANEIRRQSGIQTVNPTAGMSEFEKFRAGYGKAAIDLGRGIGQIAREGIEAISPPQRTTSDLVTGARGTSLADQLGLPTREDIDAARQRDAALMKTGAGMGGNITGAIASTLPMALIPGANTIGGGAAIGAAQGLIQPVGNKDSRLENAALGGLMGAAIPAAIRGGKIAKAALIDPFTEKGKERIIAGALRRAAANPEEAVQNLTTRTGTTPGFTPTVGQAADDQGLSALERTMRAIEPGAFGDVDRSQQAALVNALRGVAGTPEQRSAAIAARETATEPLYAAAKNATLTSNPEFESLMQRPSMQAAAEEAAKLARERGQQFAMTPGSPAQQFASPILDAAGNPMMINAQSATPATYSGQALHDLKMGLDTAIMDPQRGFMGAKKAAADTTRNEFLKQLEAQIPEYGQARQAYAEMSKPINQQDIGQALYERFVPALADNTSVPFKSRADALAQALRNGDELAKNITGMKNATMEGTMTPEQMGALRGVVSDAQMRAAQQAAGRGAGSDTVQKLAMSNLINEAGLPSWIGSVARVPGGYLKSVGNFVYGSNDEAMKGLLAETLRDPQKAAELMKKAGIPTKAYAEMMRLGLQTPALAAPAIMQGQEQ